MAKKLNLERMINDLKGTAETTMESQPENRPVKKATETGAVAKASMVMPADLWKKTKLLALTRNTSITEIVRTLLTQEITEAEKSGEIPVL